MPRPRPRLAPTTRVGLPDKSLNIISFTCMAMVWWHLLRYASLAAVFVVAAEPELPAVALVAALGHAVEDRVVAHEELHPAPGGRIGLVDGAVLERKDADQGRLGEIVGDVGPGRGRVLGHDRGQLGLGRQDGLAPLLGGGGAQVAVEVAGVRRDPGEAPAHPLLVGLQLLEWGL